MRKFLIKILDKFLPIDYHPETMPKPTNIQVVEGGERLYVHPFSYNSDYKNLKVFYLEPDEYLPYPHEHTITFNRNNPSFILQYAKFGLLKRLWYGFFKRIFVGISRYLRYSFHWGFRYNLFLYWIENSIPFLASSYPNVRFSIPRQLMVMDNEKFTETIYLIPSKKWIDIQVGNSSFEGKKEFLDWRRKEIENGREIDYLVSLDT